MRLALLASLLLLAGCGIGLGAPDSPPVPPPPVSVEVLPPDLAFDDFLVDAAYRHLVSVGAFSPARVDVVAEVNECSYMPTLGGEPPPPCWHVRFLLSEILGPPIGSVGAMIRQYEDEEGTWYEVR